MHETNNCYIKNISFYNYRAKCFAGASVKSSQQGRVENISIKDMHISIVPAPFSREILKRDASNHLFFIEKVTDIQFECIKTDYSEGLKELFKGEYYYMNK